MKLKDFVSSTVDNRGRNPEKYYEIEQYPVIDNYLIKNSIYPDMSAVNRYIDQNTFDHFLRGYVHKNMPIMTLVGNGIGNVTLAPSDDVAIIQNTIGFECNDKIDEVFLYYYLLYRQEFIRKFDRGSGQPSIRKTDLLDMKVNVPNISKQKRIREVLFSIDEKIENNNVINNNLEQQASVLVRQYCESLTSSVELGTVLSFENGFAFQSSSYHEKGKYRIITIKNVQDGRIDAQGAACIDDIPPRMKQGCFLTIGDVLLSLTGNVGRVGIVCENDLLLNQRVAKFIPKDIRTLPLLYFYFRLHSTKISLETISKGTAQQNLSPIETLKLEIPYETKQALELSNLLQPIFDTIYQKNIENIQLAEIRDSLLPKLMSGELDVSDIDL